MIFKVRTPKDKGLGSLLSDLSSLENEKVIVAPDMDSITESKKGKKKETKGKKGKKKKKDDDIELLSTGRDSEEGASVDEFEDPDIANMMRLLDVDEIMNRDFEGEENISDPIISAERGSYKRRKKDSNEYKKEFAEELTLLYDLLGDTKQFSDKLRKFINLDGKQIGSMSKTMSELIGNYLQAQNSQLQVLKEISSIKKTAVDLTMKAEAKKGKEEGSGNDAKAIAGIINGIMKTGRSDFVSAVRGNVGYLPQDSFEETGDYAQDYGHMMQYGGGMTNDDRDSLMEEIEDRLSMTGYLEESSEMDAYLKYEKRDVRVCVKQEVETGEWEFVAIDRDEIVIPDYPLPLKRDTEPMRFTGNIAVDRRGVQYRIIEY